MVVLIVFVSFLSRFCFCVILLVFSQLKYQSNISQDIVSVAYPFTRFCDPKITALNFAVRQLRPKLMYGIF